VRAPLPFLERKFDEQANNETRTDVFISDSCGKRELSDLVVAWARKTPMLLSPIWRLLLRKVRDRAREWREGQGQGKEERKKESESGRNRGTRRRDATTRVMRAEESEKETR